MAILGRNALFGTAVMAALGVPFALSDKEESATGTSHSRVDPNSPAAIATAADKPGPSGLSTTSPSPLEVEGAKVVDLAEVLRFDISPSWIMQRWPRVMNARQSAGLLHAYRVPLVTGSQAAELAGALTYSFDEEQKLQRIQFQGSSGNAQTLADFLTQQHGFARRLSGDPGQMVYDVRRDGQVVSQLVIRNAPVIDASLPQGRFRVELSMDRPSDHRMFSNAAGHRFDSHRWP